MLQARRLYAIPAAALAGLALALGPTAEAGAAKTPQPSVLSSRADMVSGGEALIGVRVPAPIEVGDVRIRLNGRDVSPLFAPSADDPRTLVGLVGGLRDGINRIAARERGGGHAGEVSLFNTPASEPLFSGPHQEPFFCRTDDAGLGPATDADCSAPTSVVYRYRSTDGSFKTLADPTVAPPDLAQTTTRDGVTVDYVVRVESGVINRSIYRWAILAPGGITGQGWNGRFIHSFGGGCGAGYQQGASGLGTVLDHRQLSRGFSVTSASLTVLGTACNDVLSAETLSRVKEHLIESLHTPPVWTLGDGGSGGSIQQHMIAQNYPGLLDGLMPSASFPDNAESKNPDCRLLQAYFGTATGALLSDAQKASVTGLPNGPQGCLSHGVGADVIRASEGCDESVVPPAEIFDPQTNPDGIRCTLWDSMVNVYGRDPGTGSARRALDNVGVQYGLLALQEGAITLDQFLDLNEGIGGFDANGVARPERSVADPDALATAHRTGRITTGAGGLDRVPIVDMRNYVDDEPTNVHQYISTFRFRQRLLEENGSFGNQVMLRAEGGGNVAQMNDYGVDLISEWLDRIEADGSDRPLAEKVLAQKPAEAVDACWIGGQRIVEPAAIGAVGPCATAYPPHAVPDMRAGKPLGSLIAKCQLRPPEPGDYPPMTPAQSARLASIFPGGVCDYSTPGVGQQDLGGTWLSFGPERRIENRRRTLRLQAGRRERARVMLAARLGPCPAVTWQRLRFERRRRGGWRPIGSKTVAGERCEAKLRVPLGRGIVVRATSKRTEGFAGARSKNLRLAPIQ